MRSRHFAVKCRKTDCMIGRPVGSELTSSESYRVVGVVNYKLNRFRYLLTLGTKKINLTKL